MAFRGRLSRKKKADIYEQLAQINKQIRTERQKIKLCREIADSAAVMQRDVAAQEKIPTRKKKQSIRSQTGGDFPINVGNSEAAEQVVHMMLSGGEVAVKLAGSAAKNAAAMLLALARNHKKVYGKTSLKKILQQTRDIRTFSLTPEQYREFSRQAKDKVLFAGIQDKEQPDAPIDLVIPTTDLELANVIFERLFGSLEKLQEERSSKKRVSVGTLLGRYRQQLAYEQEELEE